MDEKPWQKGIKLSTLKSVASVFKKGHYKAFTYGPFETPNEAAVADAMSKHRCFGGKLPNGGRWVAFGSLLSRPSKHVDFTGAEYVIPSGVFFVSDFAYLDTPAMDAVIALLNWINPADAPTPRIAIEIHEEDEDLKAALLSQDATYLLTKVSASSQLRSLYAWGLHRDPLPWAEEFTLSRVSRLFVSEGVIESILGELFNYEQYNPAWADHYSSYNKRHSWSAFALRGYKPDDPNFIIKPSEMSRAWKKDNPGPFELGDTSAYDYFPTVREVVDSIPGEKDRVRFMRLVPQGELTRHADITDRDAGVQDGKVARLHIPLVTNPGVQFYAVTHRGQQLNLQMRAGGLYYLDQRKPHFVLNESPNDERIHLVVDVISSPKLRRALERSKDGES